MSSFCFIYKSATLCGFVRVYLDGTYLGYTIKYITRRTSVTRKHRTFVTHFIYRKMSWINLFAVSLSFMTMDPPSR